jgi:two-component system NtrC family sensor kinase
MQTTNGDYATTSQFTPKVLVVDDHEPAAMMLKRLFENQNYDVVCVYSGEEALEWLKYDLPDLIILDVMMPGLNGFEVLKILREQERTSEIPTILATAKDTVEDIEHGLKLGADDYVPKPIKPRELLARAHSKIEARQLRQQIRRRTRDLEALLRVSEALNMHLNINEVGELLLVLTLDLLPLSKTQFGLFDIQHQLIQGASIIIGNTVQETFDIRTDIQEKLLSTSTFLWQSESAAGLIHHVSCILPHGEDGYGILLAESKSPLDEEHLRVFEAIAKQGTLALRNAILYSTKLQYADHLEDMVEERTRELKETQSHLIQSEKLASVGRLAAGIAHEINNPLTPIQLILEGMHEDIEYGDDIRVEDIQRILESVIRIKGVVERLQQFTRKRHDERAIMRRISLHKILENLLALTQKVMQQQRIEIRTNIDDKIEIMGNADQLEQVFLNLMLNAQSAIGENGHITITSEKDGDYALFIVEDNGKGIAEDIIDKIFEPFMTTKDDGSGLGLFISYGIVENHGGDIEVESQWGQGTRFTVKLPLAK